MLEPVRLIWSLAGSGIGTTISGAGDSGAWSAANPNAETPVDLRWAKDILITAFCASVTSAPTLSVFLDIFDDLGNLFPKAVTGPVVTAAASAGAKLVSAGLHGGYNGTASSYLVLPAWGRLSWTCSGGSTAGTEIAVWAR